MRHQTVRIGIIVSAAAFCAHAQWVNYRVPGTPHTRNGKPDLSAPPPRLDGRPDLTGIWQAESAPPEQVQQFLLPGGINGLGEDLPSKYFFNFFADLPSGNPPLQPAALVPRAAPAARPQSLCTLPSVPLEEIVPSPFKFIQTRRVVLQLYEADTVFRQIFTDGRKLPEDPQPSWLGYSVGKWDRDSLVVETIGFNDKSPLDALGHMHSESLRLTERFRRPDFGHLDAEITVADFKTYTRPVTVHVRFQLLPNTELIESFCTEAESDLAHQVASH